MLMRATLAIALVWLFVALAAGLVMQAELIAPGLQIYLYNGQSAPELHNEFWGVHGAIAISAFPVTALGAVGCLHLASFREPSSPIGMGETAAAGALILLGGLFVASAIFQRDSLGFVPVRLSTLGLAGVGVSVIAASLACSRDQPSRRAAAPWLVFALVLATIAAYLRMVLNTVGTDYILHDTHYTVAAWHAGGGALALLMMGLWSAVARRAGKHMLGWLSAVLAGTIALAWTGVVIGQAQLGLMGMPRLYSDYADVFSALQARSGICAGLAVALWALALVRLGLARKTLPREGPASAF